MNSVASQSSSSGLRGPLALRAEILHRLHQARAEVHLPEPVHGHARGQRIGRDRPATCAKPRRLLRTAGGQRRQHRGHAGRDLLAGPVVGAAHQHETCRAAWGAPASPSRWGSFRRMRALCSRNSAAAARRRGFAGGAFRSRKKSASLSACALRALVPGAIAAISLTGVASRQHRRFIRPSAPRGRRAHRRSGRGSGSPGRRRRRCAAAPCAAKDWFSSSRLTFSFCGSPST